MTETEPPREARELVGQPVDAWWVRVPAAGWYDVRLGPDPEAGKTAKVRAIAQRAAGCCKGACCTAALGRELLAALDEREGGK